MRARRARRFDSVAQKSWQLRYALFDLDNTLYPKNSGVMEAVSRRISTFMATRLGMEEATINELRPRYWKQYGTTMRGLLVEYGIDPDEYLWYVHDFAMTDYLGENQELDRALAEMPWRKVIFTNASRQHALNALAAMGIRQHFQMVFDIKDTAYIGKPDIRAYQQVLNTLEAAAQECIIIEDSAVNLRPAKELGMITVLVGQEGAVDGADFAIGRIEDVARVAGYLTTNGHESWDAQPRVMNRTGSKAMPVSREEGLGGQE